MSDLDPIASMYMTQIESQRKSYESTLERYTKAVTGLEEEVAELQKKALNTEVDPIN